MASGITQRTTVPRKTPSCRCTDRSMKETPDAYRNGGLFDLRPLQRCQPLDEPAIKDDRPVARFTKITDPNIIAEFGKFNYGCILIRNLTGYLARDLVMHDAMEEAPLYQRAKTERRADLFKAERDMYGCSREFKRPNELPGSGESADARNLRQALAINLRDHTVRLQAASDTPYMTGRYDELAQRCRPFELLRMGAVVDSSIRRSRPDNAVINGFNSAPDC